MDDAGTTDAGTDARPPTTGDPRVDRALTELGDLAERPLGEHADLLAQAHERLHTALEPDEPLDPDAGRG